MKKFILILLATAGAFQLQAQNINPETDYVPGNVAHKIKIIQPDSMLSRWVIDVNLMGGGSSENVSTKTLASGYPDPVTANTKISDLKFSPGGAFGIDAQVGYFFGHKRHFGVGAGLMYLYEHTNATVDNFHVEYQSTDNFGDVFRQELTATHQIKESVNISDFNIPIVFKYKTKISNAVGFTADAGLLVNVTEQNHYSTNAAFDYEAVYQYVGSEGGTTTVYDNAPTPAASDLAITKSRYLATQSSANIQSYFNSERAQGYNVGLGVTPTKTTGSVAMHESVGFLLRPAISLYLSDMVALNFGLYYTYQDFSHITPGTYQVTDKVGGYNSVLNSVKTMGVSTYGITAGVRFFLPHKENMEEIVIPEAPAESPAENEEKPEEPEVATITEPSSSQIDISTPILFDIDKTVIKHAGYAILEEAIRTLKENPQAYLVIHGYTDNTGTVAYNKGLSRRRALAVKNYLRRHGVKTSKIKTIGHGESSPAASNHTRSGRAKNRRAVMRLKQDE